MVALLLMVSHLLLLSMGSMFSQKFSEEMSISWTFMDDQIIIRLQCKINFGYCAIGLRRRMINTDMLIVQTDGNYVRILDAYSYFHFIPPEDIELGGTNDFKYISGGIDALGNIDITVGRTLLTSDEYDQEIFKDKPMEISWAYSNNTDSIDLHDDCGMIYLGSAIITFASTAELLYFSKLGLDLVTKDHIDLMSISWSVIAVIGVASARYFKWTSWWLYLHFLCFAEVIIATIVSSSKQFQHDKIFIDSITDFQRISSRLGFFILTLCTGQGLFGLCILYFRTNTTNYQALSFMTRAHKVIGWLLIFCSFVAIYLGRGFIGSEYWFYLFMFILLLGTEFAVRILNIANNHRFIVANLKTITHEEAFDAISKGEKLMFADDLVINVRHFQYSHPGGKYMITEAIGEDTGKYMTGCSSYGGKYQPYAHSELAFSYLSYLAIGKIPYPKGYLISKTEQNQDLMEFMIYSQQPIADNIWLLSLKSNDFQMAEEPCLAWLGKHFKIMNKTNYGEKIRRYYSSLFVNLGIWGRALGVELPGLNECKGCVRLIYKAYPGGKMSQYLSTLPKGMPIQMQGPLGPGLMIKEFKGSYLAFAGGTGLVPFLDLIYLIWRNHESITDFTFTIYISFRSRVDSFCLELLERVEKIIGGRLLNIHYLMSDNKSKLKLEDIIENMTNDAFTKIWVCGPSGFNRTVRNLLVSNGEQQEKIIIM